MPFNDALSAIKVGADVLRAADKIPEYQALIEAYGSMADLRVERDRLYDENKQLRNEINAMLDDAEKIAVMTRDGDFLRDPSGHAFCVACALSKRRASPLVHSKTASGGATTQCAVCKQTFHRYLR